MSNLNDYFGQISRLQQAEAKLTQAVIENAESNPNEEDFFKSIQDELDDLCAAIAEAVDADTCAFFFVKEDIPTESECGIVMRAASGNFIDILKLGRSEQEVRGYAYQSRSHEIKKGMSTAQQNKIIQGWSVTNQIWHLGDGRLANSNRAMNVLALSHLGRMGQGDVMNYPNFGTLQSVFRNMVGIPIFARGGATPILVESKEEQRSSLALQDRAEFLSRYRVTGILKIENKKPQRHTSSFHTEQSIIENCPDGAKKRLHQWFEKKKTIGDLQELFYGKLLFTINLNFQSDLNNNRITKELRKEFENHKISLPQNIIVKRQNNGWHITDNNNNQIFTINKRGDQLNIYNIKAEDPDGFDLLNLFPDGTHEKTIEEKKRLGAHPDSDLIDYLAEVLDAQFTQEDAELLVSLSMQLGRILARRTIEHSAQHNIVISEHEVGTLNVHYRDITQLETLFRTCDCLRQKLELSFQLLKTDLTFEKQREIYQNQISHKIEPREPIRKVNSRLKHPISLFRKLVNKQEALERQQKVKHLILHEVDLQLDNFGSLSERQAIVGGQSRLYCIDPPHGSA